MWKYTRDDARMEPERIAARKYERKAMTSPLDRSWTAVATGVDLLPFWKRHLRGQMRLYNGINAHGDVSRLYCAAVTWGVATFLHALQDCPTEHALRECAQDSLWWNRICQRELDSPSLLELRIGGVPLSGKGVSESALALRYLELTRRITIDPTTVLSAPPPAVVDWLREE